MTTATGCASGATALLRTPFLNHTHSVGHKTAEQTAKALDLDHLVHAMQGVVVVHLLLGRFRRVRHHANEHDVGRVTGQSAERARRRRDTRQLEHVELPRSCCVSSATTPASILRDVRAGHPRDWHREADGPRLPTDNMPLGGSRSEECAVSQVQPRWLGPGTRQSLPTDHMPPLPPDAISESSRTQQAQLTILRQLALDCIVRSEARERVRHLSEHARRQARVQAANA